jgi:hypothetical protein
MPARAHATLVAGCGFLSRHAPEAAVSGSPWAHKVHDRVTANHLRELDRFLSVLLEEIARTIGGPEHDADRFERANSTARMLRIVERITGTPSDAHLRLRAIGRIAQRLRRDQRPAKAHLLASDMLLASGGAPSGTGGQAGGGLRLSREAVQSISIFYRDLGDRLMEEARLFPVNIDFSADDTYLCQANVACDGI